LLLVYHSLIGEFERRGLAGSSGRGSHRRASASSSSFVASEDPLVAEQVFHDLRTASIDHLDTISLAEIDAAGGGAARLEARVGRAWCAQRVFWAAVLGTKKMLCARPRRAGPTCVTRSGSCSRSWTRS
jgi:hypothetical protein